MNKSNQISPRQISIQIEIWKSRINKAKSHPHNYQSWCQLAISEMEDWLLHLSTMRLEK